MPAMATPLHWPARRCCPSLQLPLETILRITTNNAASTSSKTNCSAMCNKRSCRLSTSLHHRNLHAASTKRPAAEKHHGSTSTQPWLPKRPPATQSAAIEVARTPPPKKTKMALFVLMQMPRQVASKDTMMKTTVLGTIVLVSPCCTLSRYLHSMISAARAKAMKIKPRKAKTMSGRISVRMLGLLSPSRAWRSLRQSWMYGQDANQEATTKTRHAESPNHTGRKTSHQEGSASQPSAADTVMTRAPCEKTKASLPATRKWRVRNAVFSWADWMSDSWAPSGSKSMDSRRQAAAAPPELPIAVGTQLVSPAAKGAH
mmetsp:Transcript_137173/g.382621  ORF Transcript_137173/g.382621 Transcript_137173/m.382621 type:complete len:316 (+) Transcript_137173:226-1173(+)